MSASDKDYERLARGSLIATVGTILGAAIVIASLIYSGTRITRGEQAVAALATRADSLRILIAAQESTLRVLTPAAATGLGYADPERVASPDSLAESLKAADVVRSAGTEGVERRRRITVRYYERGFEASVNQRIVLPALERLGFRLVGRPTAQRLANVETNAIWIGSGVDIQDAKLVALVLTTAGVHIRGIREFRDPEAKPYTIEIGADRALVDQPVWTTDRVVNARSFSRATQDVDPPG